MQTMYDERVDWPSVRREFPLNPAYTHLSQFYIVSHPRVVREAIERHRRAIDTDPFLATERGMFGTDAQRRLPRVYEAAAGYVGGRPEDIALIPNTTTGLALVYHGLPLKPGDEILTTTHDHFTQHEAIRLATQRVGARYRKIVLFDDPARPDLDEALRRLKTAIGPETKAVGLTWVWSNTGLKLPVRRFADVVAEANRGRSAGDEVLLVIDGTHGFGASAEAVVDLGADFFISSTHKWIFGPRGTGILHAKASTWARIQPTIPTYYTWDLFDAWADEREPGPTRASYVSPGGFLAYEHQWAMAEAFGFHEGIGRERVAARVTELNARLKRGLERIPRVVLHTPTREGWSAGIVCFDIDGIEPADVVSQLLERRIIASTTPYKNPCARLSAGIMNDEAEVDRAVAAVSDVARARAVAV